MGAMIDRLGVTRRLAALVFVCLFAACSGNSGTPNAPTPAPPPGGGGVLFIGNSLTESNNIHEMVAELARVGGTAAIPTRAVTFGGFNLEDHWNNGLAQRAIQQGGWSIVVLQQGPSSLPASQVDLREWTVRFDQEIRRAGAQTALYMVWPALENFANFDGVSASYSNAAQAVGGLLFPAGEAWRSAWRTDASLPLYSSDNFHPSAMGTYLAALVIYQRISGHPLIGLPPRLTSPTNRFPPVVLTSAQAAILQAAAVDANTRFR